MSATRVYTPPRLVAVLLHNQQRNATPHLFVERDQAYDWLQCGFAWRLSRWTIVLKKPTPLKLRGPSGNIREDTIISAVMGSKYHQSLIEAWRGPKHRIQRAA